MVDTLHADHIAAGGGAGGFEPQRTNHFLLRISGVDGAELIEQTLQSFPFPKYAVNPIEIKWRNSTRKVAGEATFEAVQLVLFDSFDKNVADAIYDWFVEVYDPDTEQHGLAKDYKKDGTLVLFAPDGSNERKWKLVGIWPSNVDMGDGNYETVDKVQITVTLQIDKVVRDN